MHTNEDRTQPDTVVQSDATVVSNWVPAARQDLAIVPPEEGGKSALIVDQVLGQQFRLQADALALLATLDRPKPLEQVSTEYAQTTPDGADPSVLRVTLDRFSRLLLLDDERYRAARFVVEQTERWRQADPAEVPLHFLPEARFRCTCCGGCCGGHNIGPVRRGLAEQLRQIPELVESTGVASSKLFFTRRFDDHEMLLCQSRNRSCVFLDEDLLCRIHQSLGGAAKPSPCQLFPFTFVARPDGIAVGVDPECRHLLLASFSGPFLRDDDRDVRAVLPLAGRIPRVRPVLQLEPGLTLSWAAYRQLEQECLDVLAMPERLPDAKGISGLARLVERPADDPVRLLLALNDLLDHRGRSLAEGKASQSAGSGSDAGADMAEAFCTTLLGLADGLVQRRAELGEGDDAYVVAAEGLEGAVAGLREMAHSWPRLVAPEPDPAIRTLFLTVARNAWHSHEVGNGQTLRVGLARLSFQWWLARGIALARARSAKRVRVQVQDVLDGLVLARVLARTNTGAYRSEPPLPMLLRLFVNQFPALVAEPNRFTRTDSRVTVFMG